VFDRNCKPKHDYGKQARNVATYSKNGRFLLIAVRRVSPYRVSGSRCSPGAVSLIFLALSSGILWHEWNHGLQPPLQEEAAGDHAAR